MTARPSETLAEAMSAVRELLGDGTADEVTCEITRHGTMKIVAKRTQGAGVVRHEFRARPGK